MASGICKCGHLHAHHIVFNICTDTDGRGAPCQCPEYEEAFPGTYNPYDAICALCGKRRGGHWDSYCTREKTGTMFVDAKAFTTCATCGHDWEMHCDMPEPSTSCAPLICSCQAFVSAALTPKSGEVRW